MKTCGFWFSQMYNMNCTAPLPWTGWMQWVDAHEYRQHISSFLDGLVYVGFYIIFCLFVTSRSKVAPAFFISYEHILISQLWKPSLGLVLKLSEVNPSHLGLIPSLPAVIPSHPISHTPIYPHKPQISQSFNLLPKLNFPLPLAKGWSNKTIPSDGRPSYAPMHKGWSNKTNKNDLPSNAL